MPTIQNDVTRCNCGKELTLVETHELRCLDCDPTNSRQLGYDELYELAFSIYTADDFVQRMRALLMLHDRFEEVYRE